MCIFITRHDGSLISERSRLIRDTPEMETKWRALQREYIICEEGCARAAHDKYEGTSGARALSCINKVIHTCGHDRECREYISTALFEEFTGQL
ncbi:unnamed protein product [Arctia plantaginis]|uniref:Uncharacterized protein n=1 Tax=Arctia plantaginis TaxID=874455 RepID=A0A8S1A8H5_ARCPL|nr:unnamed protein product [Arctia plantaginis]